MRLGERFEQSRVGQVLLTVGMLVVIAAVIGWNFPAGKAHDEVGKVTTPVVQAIGFEQDWALFAPVPREFSVGVYADLVLRNGSVVTWTPPHNGLFLAPYRTYRWQKFVERLRGDDYSGLWEPTAQWLVGQYGGPAKVSRVDLYRTCRSVTEPSGGVTTISRAELIRTCQPVPKQGSGSSRAPTQRFLFYTYEVPQ